MKVMVVDDEMDVKILFQQKFRKEIKSGQINFHFAFSGEEGLGYCKENDLSDLFLILSDINMPGMNGLELLKNVKELNPNIPVYMITAYGDENNFRQAQEYGCDDYITKPLDFNTLKEKIFNQDPND
jgi:CheY-like chemotaxis protein